MPEPGLPESFNVLMHELKGLGLDVQTRRISDNFSESFLTIIFIRLEYTILIRTLHGKNKREVHCKKV